MRAIREDTRESILDAADRLLERHGYKKMRVDDIAEEAGIGKGSVYLHFSSKEDVALAHIDRIVERVLRRLNQIADSAETPVTKIHLMLVTRVLLRFDSVQHYTRSLNDLLAELRTNLLARRERHFDDEASIFARVLEEGRQQQLFFISDVNATARLLLLATNSLLPYSLSVHELGHREEIEARASGIAALVIDGLQQRPMATK